MPVVAKIEVVSLVAIGDAPARPCVLTESIFDDRYLAAERSREQTQHIIVSTIHLGHTLTHFQVFLFMSL